MKTLYVFSPILFIAAGIHYRAPASKLADPPGSSDARKSRQTNATRVETPEFLKLLQLGSAAQAKGDNEEAERLYKESIASNANWPMGYWRLAKLYDKQGREREAYAAWGRALASYEPYASSMRDDPGPLVRFGDLAERFGTLRESSEAYALAIAAGDRDDVWEPRPVPRDDSYRALKAAAHTAAAAEDIWGGEGHAAALRELDVALAADPNLWSAHYYRACVYSRHRRKDEAMREAAIAERLAPVKGRRQIRWMRAGRGIPDLSGRLLSIPPAPKSGSWVAPPDLP